MSINGKHLLFFAEHPKCNICVFSEKFINFFKTNYKNINVNFYVMDEKGEIYNKDMVYDDYLVQLVINTVVDSIISENKLHHEGVTEKNDLLITFENIKIEAQYKLIF